jgi:hypothetical protein
MVKNFLISEEDEPLDNEHGAETEYWNSICEYHKVAPSSDPYPCMTKEVDCCPMNSVLSKRGELQEKMKAKGYTHAVWAVYKDVQINAIPMCSLVWLTEEPSDEVLREIFEDRLIRYSPAEFGCTEECSCHHEAKRASH